MFNLTMDMDVVGNKLHVVATLVVMATATLQLLALQ